MDEKQLMEHAFAQAEQLRHALNTEDSDAAIALYGSLEESPPEEYAAVASVFFGELSQCVCELGYQQIALHIDERTRPLLEAFGRFGRSGEMFATMFQHLAELDADGRLEVYVALVSTATVALRDGPMDLGTSEIEESEQAAPAHMSDMTPHEIMSAFADGTLEKHMSPKERVKAQKHQEKMRRKIARKAGLRPRRLFRR